MKYNWKNWKLQKEGFSAYDPENDDPADNPNYDFIDELEDELKPKYGRVDQVGINPRDKAGKWLKIQQGMQPNIRNIKQGVENGAISPEDLAQLQRIFGFPSEVMKEIDPEGYERKRQLQRRIAGRQL